MSSRFYPSNSLPIAVALFAVAAVVFLLAFVAVISPSFRLSMLDLLVRLVPLIVLPMPLP